LSRCARNQKYPASSSISQTLSAKIG
jgi:hypothetical protein